MVLGTGDELKMLVELKEPCHVYVIHRSPADEWALVFPYELEHLARDPVTSERLYIPAGEVWFQLDDETGLERIYLLASRDRLVKLEASLLAYDAAEPERRPEAGDRIRTEILDLRRAHRSLAAHPERPIGIGGNVRAMMSLRDTRRLDGIAAELSADDFLIRVYGIDHR